MNFWKFFKGETTEELIARSTAAVKERYNRGMRARTSYMEMYNTEMRNLESLEDDIVSPPMFTIKKDNYRNERLRVLNCVISECKNCFSNDIDDRLHEAEIFRDSMTRRRALTLNNISANGRKTTLERMNHIKVGSITNPGAFRVKNNITQKFEARKKQKAVSLDFIEENIKDDVKKALDVFDPQAIWKQDVDVESLQDYNTLKKHYDDLKAIMKADYAGDDRKSHLKDLAIDLGLTENENSSISSVLREKDTEGVGASGLDFMAVRHPDILADVILHKLLTKMQSNSLEFIQRKPNNVDIQDLLNPKGYVDLLAQAQALSCVTGELDFLEQDLHQEFEQFKNGKILDQVDKHVKKIRLRILNGLLDEKELGEIYENEMNAMMEIRNKIIKPNENVEDKDEFRKAQMRIFEEMIQKYKECFGDHVDDHGLFYSYNEIDSGIKKLENSNEQPTVEFVREKVETLVKKEMQDYSPYNVLADVVELERKEECERCLKYWKSISVLSSPYNGKLCKERIQKVAVRLNLNGDLKHTFKGIFDQESDIPGITGLDFLAEYYPDFLVNKLFLKMLNNYDESVLRLVRNKKELFLLNLPQYTELYTKKKTLERAVNLYPLLDSELKAQYEEFKTRQTVALALQEMHKRISSAVGKGNDIEQIYDMEMTRLADSQKKIVEFANNGQNLDEKVLILHNEIVECKDYFAKDMDDRLHEAEIFIENVDTEDEKDRNEFLEQVNVRGLDTVLREKNKERVGSDKNPGIFQFKNTIDSRFEGKNEQQKIPVEFMEGDVHEDVMRMIGNFEPQTIQGDEDYETHINNYNFLKNTIINNNYESQKQGLWVLAKIFNLDRNIDSPISVILQKEDTSEYSGLIFMVECHPQILADVMLYKVLENMDKAYLEQVKDKGDLTLLKSDEYLNLYARKKALSSFTGRLAQSMDDLKSEYLQFKLYKKFKIDDNYKEFSKFWDGKKGNEDFAEGFDDAFNATCKAHFKLISRYLKGKIFLTKEERILLDSHMGEIIKAMRYVRVDSNQSNTCTTKFFNAIGWSSNKVNTSDDIGEKKMFYTISPSREIKAQEMVKQLIGKGDYLGQHYSKRNDIGEGIYAWAANPDMKVDGAEETSSNTSWSDGRQKGSVQFTVALNKRAKVIDNEQVGEKMSDFKEKFPNTYASSKSYGKDEKKFQSIFLAFMGYNVNRMKAADESGGADCYCITDPKVITMDPTIAVRVGAGRKNNNTQRPTIVSQKLEEYLA